jgi:hypothetical protein
MFTALGIVSMNSDSQKELLACGPQVRMDNMTMEEAEVDFQEFILSFLFKPRAPKSLLGCFSVILML